MGLEGTRESWPLREDDVPLINGPRETHDIRQVMNYGRTMLHEMREIFIHDEIPRR